MATAEHLLTFCFVFWVSGTTAEREYTHIEENKSWLAARDHCRKYYTDLAIISNSIEHEKVKQMSLSSTAWIGLYWCSGDQWLWSSGTNMSYSHWKSTPSNNPDKACVKIDSNDDWRDDKCEEERDFICYKDIPVTSTQVSCPSSCQWDGCRSTYSSVSLASKTTEATTRTTSPRTEASTKTTTLTTQATTTHSTSSSAPTSSGASTTPARTSRASVRSPWVTDEIVHPSLITHGSSSTSTSTSIGHVTMSLDAGSCSSCTLYLILERMSWSEARSHCKMNHTDLASVSVEDIQWAISKLLAYPDTAPGVWIGLRRSRVWGYWFWVNEDPFDFSNWGQGEPSNPPSERCGIVSKNPGRNYTWEDECCGVRLPSICYE